MAVGQVQSGWDRITSLRPDGTNVSLAVGSGVVTLKNEEAHKMLSCANPFLPVQTVEFEF